MNFTHIKTAVAKQFQHLQSQPQSALYRVAVDRDLLWSTYLSSFPPGTDPLYRQRTGHDCSCCRQFIRTVGDVVAVIDGQVVSIWDIVVLHPYQTVVDALSRLVHSCPIVTPFYHYERTAGTDKNFEELQEKGVGESRVKTWTHFHVNIDRRYVRPKSDIPTLLSEAQSSRDVFLRSLTEITHDAIDIVLDLIAQNSLYRGEEHRALVQQFQRAKRTYDAIIEPGLRDVFGFAETGAVARIRNTAIGTLLCHLSEGWDIEEAVKAFEIVMAPGNYRRPSALVTPAMVAKAKSTLQELGLLSALERRYATLSDLTVNDILFADRTARKSLALTGDVFDELIDSSPATSTLKNLDKVEEVPVTRFLSDILPRIDSLEVLFENRHTPNLVSLIAPSDPTSRPLFKWGNLYSWSYSGELADAIKERVKKAGGNVSGDLSCRLAWGNYDDLDFHMVEPDKYEIYYATRRVTSPSGGRLDVDMNAGRGTTREPVENIYYQHRARMVEGAYHLYVHQFCSRESTNVGFECEIDYLGQVYRFAYDKPVRQGEKITVAKFRYTHKGGIEIVESLPSTQSSRVVWGLPTQTFHRVNVLTLSPNCWGQQHGDSDYSIGNRHYFFMLDGATNDGSARGFFNEFLREDLNVHRKTMEVVASKMKPESSDDQLSGLGFSSTRRDTVICRVKGKGNFQRTIKVTF